MFPYATATNHNKKINTHSLDCKEEQAYKHLRDLYTHATMKRRNYMEMYVDKVFREAEGAAM